MMLIKKSEQKNKQHGAALIAVLLILVVVTLLGISAMRMGLTGLTVATNSQLSSLLFQAADKGMTDFQNAIRNNGTSGASVAAAMKSDGLISALKGRDVAYCLTPTASASLGLTAGACDTGASASFLNARQITMTQVNYQRRRKSEYDASAGMDSGTGNTPIPTDILIVPSTSVMPTLGSASLSTVNGCLRGTDAYMTSGLLSDDALDASEPTITDCLTDKGAVFTTHQDEFEVGFQF